MATGEVPTKLNMENLLTALDELPNQGPRNFVQRVRALQIKRSFASVEAEDEQALLQLLATPSLSESDQARLDLLRQKNDDEILTSEEHAELLRYVQRVEQQNLIRVEALIELAQRRGATLRGVMQQLEIELNDA